MKNIYISGWKREYSKCFWCRHS